MLISSLLLQGLLWRWVPSVWSRCCQCIVWPPQLSWPLFLLFLEGVMVGFLKVSDSLFSFFSLFNNYLCIINANLGCWECGFLSGAWNCKFDIEKVLLFSMKWIYWFFFFLFFLPLLFFSKCFFFKLFSVLNS